MPALLSTTASESAVMDSFTLRPIPCTALYSDALSVDTVSLSPDIARTLYGQQGPFNSHVVIHGINQDTNSERKWTLFRVTNTPSSENNTCVLSTSNKLHNGPPAGSRILIQAINPVELDQLLVLCSPESYDRVKNNENQVLSQLLGDADSRIIRQGEFDFNLNASFKLCEPVDQGLLTASTKVTVIKGKTALSSDHEDLEVEIANYLGYSKTQAIQELDVVPLTAPVNVNSLIPRPGVKDDPQARAFVRVEQLISIGVFSGDTVSTTIIYT